MFCGTGRIEMRKKSIYLIVSAVLAVPILIVGIASLVPDRPLLPTKPGSGCRHNLQIVEGAKQQWAIENGKTTNDLAPTAVDLETYCGRNALECPCGGKFTIGQLDQSVTCSLKLEEHTWVRWDAFHSGSKAP